MNKQTSIDTLEDLYELDNELLEILLKDKTTKQNIVWATNDYDYLGNGYRLQDEITTELITGLHSKLIQPRTAKKKGHQTIRTQNKAEVFTPAWVCNEQINLIDECWFEEKNVFNVSKKDEWKVNTKKIKFLGDKSWKEYVDTKRLEIACGEAPYLVSRYDAATGKKIDITRRVGILDRKIRIINENVQDEKEWIRWVTRAFQSVYGYEYQGDNLLLARSNLFFSYIDYFEQKFGRQPVISELVKIANVIAWNIWQMDGVTCMTPIGQTKEVFDGFNLFEDEKIQCQLCKIQDWRSKESITYISLRR